MSDDFSPVIKLTICRGGSKFFGPGVADLLDLIGDKGSVKEACRTMGLSYSKGRTILKRAEKMLGFPLVETRHGGQGGGAAALTDEAVRLIQNYRKLAADVDQYAEDHFKEMFQNSF